MLIMNKKIKIESHDLSYAINQYRIKNPKNFLNLNIYKYDV